jgi:hypothetical protein
MVRVRKALLWRPVRHEDSYRPGSPPPLAAALRK